MVPICNIRLRSTKPHRLPLPDPKDTSLGAELKRKRLALEWSQKETAKHFKILKDSYQKWEWNQIVPHIRNRKRVIQFLEYNYWDDGTNSLPNKCLLHRIEHGLTMSELAKKLSVSCRTIERVEMNEPFISKEMKNLLLNYFNLIIKQ